MVEKTVLEMVLAEAAVFTGAAGAIATTSIGYVLEENVVETTFSSPGAFLIRVQGEKLPLRRAIPNRDIAVTVPAAQLNADILALALGLTKSGNTVNIADANDTILSPQISLAVVGQDLNGDTVRLDLTRVSASGESGMSMSQAVLAGAALNFTAESGGEAFLTFGDIQVTIDGGVFTRTTTAHQVVGEGAAADLLLSITGTSLADGEVLRLRPSTTSYLITLTNKVTPWTDELDLFGAADVDLGASLDDYVDLQYVLADTKWLEIGRNIPA